MVFFIDEARSGPPRLGNPSKKKIVENSTWGGPAPGIFHISKKKEKKGVFKMHFKPF